MLNNRVRDANYFTPKCIYLSFKDHKRKASSNPQAKKRPVYSFHQNGSIFWVQKCISYLSVVSVYSVLIQCSVDCLLHFKNLSCSYIYVVLKWASLIPKEKIFHEFSLHHCFPKLLIFLLEKKNWSGWSGEHVPLQCFHFPLWSLNVYLVLRVSGVCL